MFVLVGLRKVRGKYTRVGEYLQSEGVSVRGASRIQHGAEAQGHLRRLWKAALRTVTANHTNPREWRAASVGQVSVPAPTSGGYGKPPYEL